MVGNSTQALASLKSRCFHRKPTGDNAHGPGAMAGSNTGALEAIRRHGIGRGAPHFPSHTRPQEARGCQVCEQDRRVMCDSSGRLGFGSPSNP